MENATQTLEEAKKILAEVLAEEEVNEQESAQNNPQSAKSEQESAQTEQGFDPNKAAEQFDVTRAARQDALSQVETILTRAASGRNVDKKETLKCLRGLYVVAYMQDMLIKGLMGDLIGAIRAMAKVEVEQFNTAAKLFTVTQALYKKGLVSPQEMEQFHQEITVPQLLANLKGQEEESED